MERIVILRGRVRSAKFHFHGAFDPHVAQKKSFGTRLATLKFLQHYEPEYRQCCGVFSPMSRGRTYIFTALWICQNEKRRSLHVQAHG